MQMDQQAMVDLLRKRNIRDERVLKAMAAVPRHLFIPESHRAGADAYGDHPSPIGFNQTISQPYIVAYMTERLGVKPGMRVLEVGTGSGYQAGVLAELGAEVYSMEVVPELAEHARRVLKETGYEHVHLKTGDGAAGWPEEAPFDAVIATCAPDAVPPALTQQLSDGGRMILPVGTGMQRLVLLEKKGASLKETPDLYVRFVPLVRGRSGPLSGI